MMPQFIKTVRADQLDERRGTLVEVDGVELALFLRDGTYYAINNVCSHQHHSVLHRGLLDGCTVECPMHGWTYDLRSGKAVKGDGRVACYRVELRDGNLFVELPED
jgi:3-phenylpropionate/trans-cinnamate dioxygenase ferredoxin subunit